MNPGLPRQAVPSRGSAPGLRTRFLGSDVSKPRSDIRCRFTDAWLRDEPDWVWEEDHLPDRARGQGAAFECFYAADLAVLKALKTRVEETTMPAKQEFTTVEAAEFLNVSRPFVVKEIDAGRLPHWMVGTHRRIAFEDLLAYAREMRAKQRAALERMAENARALGLD